MSILKHQAPNTKQYLNINFQTTGMNVWSYGFWICLELIMWNFGFISPTRAAESALSVAPAILEYVVKPGETTHVSLEVSNTMNFPLPIKAQVSSFLANENIETTNKARFDASAWFTVEPADFILQPRSNQSVTVKITPPQDIQPGGHYATIYFSPLIPREAISAQTAVGLARVGVLTFLVAPGDLHPSLQLIKPKLPVWQTFGPVNIEIPIHNDGNTHLAPNGSVTIYNIFGREIEILPVDAGIILPETTKLMTVRWEHPLMVGKYQFVIAVENSPDINLEQKVETWIIPWPIILILILCLTTIYKVFIVNHKRLIAAVRVLRGLPANKE